MNEVICSIPVSIDIGNNYEKGWLYFLYDRIEIKGVYGNTVYDVPNWDKKSCSVLIEKNRKAFFFKIEQTVITVIKTRRIKLLRIQPQS